MIAAAVAVVIVAVTIARDNTPDNSGAAPARRGAGSTPAAAVPVPVADVKLELLQQGRPEPKKGQRNLFRFEQRAAPAPPPAAGPATPPPGTPPPVVPSGPPPPPPIGLRYIGLVDAPTQGGRIAILSDGRGNIFYGKDGDIIEGRYQVLKVSPDAAELSYLDGRGRQTIRLTGQ